MTRKKLTYIAAIVAAAMIFFFFVLGVGAQVARADASAYTNVLDDLRADESFTASDYSVNYKDNSIKVIQIAESADGELFIYTYQPTGQYRDLKASSINIARKPDNSLNLKFENYSLTFLNSAGVFFKYKVEGFELETSATRYYNISNILRPWDKIIDGTLSNGQTESEVKNRVAQLWTARTTGETVSYAMTASEVIEITKKYVGFVWYDDGTSVGWGITHGATMAHFVAFSTDKPIDKLISASITFNESEITCKLCCNALHVNHKYGGYFDYQKSEPHPHDPITLKYTEKGHNEGGNGFQPANRYYWDRIQSTSEFIADDKNGEYKLTEEGANIIGTQWVLNFYETSISQNIDNIWLPILTSPLLAGFVGDAECKYTAVSDVMLLELTFELDGTTYSLGVVDNKQTGSNKPAKAPASGCASCEWLNVLPWWAWVLIIIFAPLIIFLLFKLIVKLVTAPFKAFGRRRSEKRVVRAVTKRNKPKRKHIRGSTPKRKRKGGKK